MNLSGQTQKMSLRRAFYGAASVPCLSFPQCAPSRPFHEQGYIQYDHLTPNTQSPFLVLIGRRVSSRTDRNASQSALQCPVHATKTITTTAERLSSRHWRRVVVLLPLVKVLLDLLGFLLQVLYLLLVILKNLFTMVSAPVSQDKR
jgi:hypothetical protein